MEILKCFNLLFNTLNHFTLFKIYCKKTYWQIIHQNSKFTLNKNAQYLIN